MYYWEGHGVRLAGDAWGDPDGPLVLLQHGGGQTRHAWKGTGETLGAAGYYAIAFDARQPTHMYCATRGGEVFASSDGGESWAERPLPVGATQVYALGCA